MRTPLGRNAAGRSRQNQHLAVCTHTSYPPEYAEHVSTSLAIREKAAVSHIMVNVQGSALKDINLPPGYTGFPRKGDAKQAKESFAALMVGS